MKIKMDITSFASDGVVNVVIGGTRYTYFGVDTAFYPMIKKLERRSKWRALHMIKKLANSFEKEVIR